MAKSISHVKAMLNSMGKIKVRKICVYASFNNGKVTDKNGAIRQG
jgi:hypothetical protein